MLVLVLRSRDLFWRVSGISDIWESLSCLERGSYGTLALHSTAWHSHRHLLVSHHQLVKFMHFHTFAFLYLSILWHNSCRITLTGQKQQTTHCIWQPLTVPTRKLKLLQFLSDQVSPTTGKYSMIHNVSRVL